MNPFKAKPARAWGALILLFACFLSQAMPWPAQPREAAGEAAAAAILAPHARETCPHHPEGCPPDCLCPKDHVDAGAAALDYPTGAALSRCAGKAPAEAPAPCGLWLPEEAALAERPDPFRYLIPSTPSRPLAGYRAESAKIPIA
jgi:hypothetical protein